MSATASSPLLTALSLLLSLFSENSSASVCICLRDQESEQQHNISQPDTMQEEASLRGRELKC